VCIYVLYNHFENNIETYSYVVNNIRMGTCFQCQSDLTCRPPLHTLALDLKLRKVFQDNIDKIDWRELCLNPNPKAIHLLEPNLDKLVNNRLRSDRNGWSWLARNPNAIHILEQTLHKLGRNGWSSLSENPNAIHILEQNPDKIGWSTVWSNPNIFE